MQQLTDWAAKQDEQRETLRTDIFAQVSATEVESVCEQNLKVDKCVSQRLHLGPAWSSSTANQGHTTEVFQ